MNLIPFFESAITTLNHNKSSELGDRTTYIGSSDVGSCPRKVCLQKQQPVTADLSTMLRFSRGHVAEMLLVEMFNAAGVRHLYDTQVEVQHPDHPLKAHIDFLFYADFDGSPELHIIEVKSVSGIPDEPYPQWVSQLHFQLGLLRMQYPQGKLGGSILAIDLNAGKVHQFNGFEHNQALFDHLCSRALYLLSCLEGKEEPAASVSNICGFCPYRPDCPAMALPQVELPPEIESLAFRYAELNGTKNSAEKEMKVIRQELLDFTGPVFKGRGDTVDLVVSSIPPSKSLDADMLKQKYPDIYPALLKERAGYTKLECRPVKTAA